MTTSTRLFNCLRCHQQVMLCQSCDHGQRYCAGQCRYKARKTSLKRANQKYQNSLKGRFNNAERQSRFRRRQKQKEKIVTDQGSPSTPSHDLLSSKLCVPENTLKRSSNTVKFTCHFCGAVAGPFFRVRFLKKRTVYPYVSKAIARRGENSHDH